MPSRTSAASIAAQQVDYLVIGAGIAGLRAAITLATRGRVLVVTKNQLAESNTAYAQGGIAVAMGGSEDVALHLEDTITAGDGIVSPAAAKILVEQGPQRVAELLTWGTNFDREDGELMLTREGAHSRSRILHANGDATGREIALSLLRHAREDRNIDLLEWTTSLDLILDANKRAIGATLLSREDEKFNVFARATLLTSGGAGQVYSDTTNPAVATGDGIAMAIRAGASVSDMEFYQFHPTAISLPNTPRFLLSEALRGEGAYLRNSHHERFMHQYHPQLELAPRDVVARAITKESLNGPVYLDMRHIKKDLVERFPGISAFLAKHDLSLAKDLVPVRPAAHYMMGGVLTDVTGHTTLPGLYAAGETACTGVHGANRLASNSLLEGLVFGALAAEAMLKENAPQPTPQDSVMTGARPLKSIISTEAQRSGETSVFAVAELTTAVERWIADLQKTMWLEAGLLRNEDGLKRAQHHLAELAATKPQGETRREVEARNLLTVAETIVAAALARNESRGAHFRTDHPTRNDPAFQKHSIQTGSEVRFVTSLE